MFLLNNTFSTCAGSLTLTPHHTALLMMYGWGSGLCICVLATSYKFLKPGGVSESESSSTKREALSLVDTNTLQLLLVI